MNPVLYLVIGLLLTFLAHSVERHEIKNCWGSPGGKEVVIAGTLAGIVLWPMIVGALIGLGVVIVLMIFRAINSSPRAG